MPSGDRAPGPADPSGPDSPPGPAVPGDAPGPGDAPDLAGLRALAHPLRLRLLSLLTAAPMSSAEAARHLGQSQANVSYHMRRLHAAGLLRLTEETSVRGGRAKRYRHLADSGELLSGGSRDEYAVLVSALAEELVRRNRERLVEVAGDFTDADMTISAETWERVRGLADELGRIMHDEALPPGTAGAVRASATVMLFQMAPDGAAREAGPEARPDGGAPGAGGVSAAREGGAETTAQEAAPGGAAPEARTETAYRETGAGSTGSRAGANGAAPEGGR